MQLNVFLIRCKKAVPAILTLGSCAGVVATAVLAIKATPKASEVLKQYEESKKTETKDYHITKTEVVKVTWKYYIPTTISGVLTIGSIIVARKITLKQIAALGAACTYLNANRDNLEKEIKERLGEDTLKEIKSKFSHETAANKVNYIKSAGPSVEETGRGDLLCFDSYSGRWFRSSEVSVAQAIEHFKDAFNNGVSECFNDFYALNGLSATKFGAQYGFAANPDYYDEGVSVDYDILEGWDGNEGGGRTLDEPVLVIDWYTNPMECWDEV